MTNKKAITAATTASVAKAAQDLLARGVNVTVSSVRAELGGGSPNTITDLVREWKESHRESEDFAAVEAPDKVKERADELLGAVWTAALQVANAAQSSLLEKMKQMKMESEVETASFKDVVTAMEVEAEQLAAAISELQGKISEEKEVVGQLQQQLSDADLKLAGMAERVTAAEQRVKLADERADRAEAERDGAKADVAKAEQRADREVGAADVRATKADERATNAESRADRAEKKSEELQTQLTKVTADLGNARADLATERAQHSGTQDRLKRANDDLELAKLEAEKATTTLAERDGELIAVKEEIASLKRLNEEKAAINLAPAGSLSMTKL